MFMSNIFRIYLGWRSQVILKIIVTVKSEKGNKSTRKDVDRSIDLIEKICEYMESKLKGKMKEIKCYRDGTSVVFEK